VNKNPANNRKPSSYAASRDAVIAKIVSLIDTLRVWPMETTWKSFLGRRIAIFTSAKSMTVIRRRPPWFSRVEVSLRLRRRGITQSSTCTNGGVTTWALSQQGIGEIVVTVRCRGTKVSQKAHACPYNNVGSPGDSLSKMIGGRL